MGPVEMLLGGLPNHQTTPINETNMSKKRHTKEAQIKAIRDHASGRDRGRFVGLGSDIDSSTNIGG